MRRRVSKKAIQGWAAEHGGTDSAAIEIVRKLKCGTSKAWKLASGDYDSAISELEQQELLELTGLSVNALFPGEARAKSGEAS